jgi:hypothetical protein
VGSDVAIATGDDGSDRGPGPPATPEATGDVVVVEPRTVAATREALGALAERAQLVPVVGFADLTSPNLVDLLEDLLAGPGGPHLRAVGVPWPATGAAWVDDVAVRRGLACLQRRRLALCLLGTGPGDLPAALARVEPGLEVLQHPTRRGAAPPSH